MSLWKFGSDNKKARLIAEVVVVLLVASVAYVGFRKISADEWGYPGFEGETLDKNIQSGLDEAMNPPSDETTSEPTATGEEDSGWTWNPSGIDNTTPLPEEGQWLDQQYTQEAMPCEEINDVAQDMAKKMQMTKDEMTNVMKRGMQAGANKVSQKMGKQLQKRPLEEMSVLERAKFMADVREQILSSGEKEAKTLAKQIIKRKVKANETGIKALIQKFIAVVRDAPCAGGGDMKDHSMQMDMHGDGNFTVKYGDLTAGIDLAVDLHNPLNAILNQSILNLNYKGGSKTSLNVRLSSDPIEGMGDMGSMGGDMGGMGGMGGGMEGMGDDNAMVMIDCAPEQRMNMEDMNTGSQMTSCAQAEVSPSYGLEVALKQGFTAFGNPGSVSVTYNNDTGLSVTGTTQVCKTENFSAGVEVRCSPMETYTGLSLNWLF